MLVNKSSGIAVFLCWLTYTSAYFGRYSYASGITFVMEQYSVNHAQAGLVTTFFFFSYGAGQIIHGILCKRYNKRLVISAVLIISAIINTNVFLGIPFEYIKYLWMLNGILQSVLWPTLISALSETLQEKDLAKAVVIMSSTVTVGTFLTYGTTALLGMNGVYKYAYLTGALAMLVTAIVWFTMYKKAFVPATEVQKTVCNNSVNKGWRSVLFMVIVLGVFAVANNFVKDGLTTWVPSILKENFGLGDSLSVMLTLVLPVVGLLGAAFITLLNKRVKSFISISGICFTCASVCTAVVLFFANSSFWIIVLAAFGFVSLFMHGVNNVVTSMAPLFMRDKVNSGLLAGILNGCCYLGSTLCSYGLGFVADSYGWNGVFVLLFAVSAVPAIASAIIGVAKKINNKAVIKQ